MNIKILTKILENQIQKYSFKEDNTSGLDGVYSGSKKSLTFENQLIIHPINRLKRKNATIISEYTEKVFTKIKHMLQQKLLVK